MNKKKLVTMTAAVALAGAMGAGATLAYLSDETDTLTNTFTLGNIEITLDEEKIGTKTGERTEDGQEYGELIPGDSVTKDPTVTVEEGSADCYVFMYATGIDQTTLDAENFSISTDGEDGVSTSWSLADGDNYNGLYVYDTDSDGNGNIVSAAEREVVLPALFDTVTYSVEGTGEETITNIVVKAVAVQSKNITYDEALEQAEEILGLTQVVQ